MNGSATPFCSSPERVGRDGFLRLRFAQCGTRTILQQSRFSLPLQALAPLPLEDGSCYLMLLNPTGGVLGGDHLVTQISLEPGARVCLSTPSATRIYRALDEPAILETVIRVGEGATLEYVPDHVIPQAGSALRQSLRIEMEHGSRAIVFDSMASGRLARGERWSFREFLSRTDVSVCGKPAYANRTKIIPSEVPPGQFGLMESFDYMSCVGIFAAEFQRWQPLADAMNEILEGTPNVFGGASLLSRSGCAVRFLARSAHDMTSVNRKLWDAARELLAGLAPFAPRKY